MDLSQHEVTEEFITSQLDSPALRYVEAALRRLPPPMTQAAYIERRNALLAAEDFRGLSQMDEQCRAARFRRTELEKQRESLDRRLTRKRTQAGAHPTQEEDRQIAYQSPAVTTATAPHAVPAPHPAATFVDPSFRRIYEQAKAAALQPRPVAQSTENDEQGEQTAEEPSADDLLEGARQRSLKRKQRLGL